MIGEYVEMGAEWAYLIAVGEHVQVGITEASEILFRFGPEGTVHSLGYCESVPPPPGDDDALNWENWAVAVRVAIDEQGFLV